MDHASRSGDDGGLRDPEHRSQRIGVALVEEGSARSDSCPASCPVRTSRAKSSVTRNFVFVFLAPGRVGLVPFSETGIAREADVAKAFPVGTEIEVAVLEVDTSGRRIRLSRKAILDAREADEMREYTERADVTPAEAFGSLADQLRDALKPRQK